MFPSSKGLNLASLPGSSGGPLSHCTCLSSLALLCARQRARGPSAPSGLFLWEEPCPPRLSRAQSPVLPPGSGRLCHRRHVLLLGLCSLLSHNVPLLFYILSVHLFLHAVQMLLSLLLF